LLTRHSRQQAACQSQCALTGLCHSARPGGCNEGLSE